MSLWLGLGLCSGAAAMQLQVMGDTLVARGHVGADIAAFEAALARPGLRRVALVHSPGGDLWTALHVAQLIAERRLDTVTAGDCLSACAIMFLGGEQRRFASTLPPWQNRLGLHGAHRADTGALDESLQPQIYNWFKQRMGERFNASLMGLALYGLDDAGGMLYLPGTQGAQSHPSTESAASTLSAGLRLPGLVCNSGGTPRAACRELPGWDAWSLGVVTSPDTALLPPPATLPAAATVFGLPLGDARAKASRAKAAWASAAPAGAQTPLSLRSGAKQRQQAALDALAACNAAQGTLCELDVVDGLEARDSHAEADALHVAAWRQLEAYGLFAVPTATDTSTATQAPTPADNIRRVDTAGLVALLRQSEPPFVIDVATEGQRTVPGSVALWGGGQPADAVRGESWFAPRFAVLLALLVPERTQPVVFFAQGASDDRALRAAQRARAAGWQQVLVYADGLQAWQQAGLVSVPPRVRAVLLAVPSAATAAAPRPRPSIKREGL